MFRNLTGGRGARVRKESPSSARKKLFALHFRPQLEALESRHLLSGTGLMGEYFNNTTLTGTSALIRNDANINFSWSGSPGTGVNSDNFGIHWEGELEAVEGGNYTFRTIRDSNAGVRLWINGQLKIDNWTGSTTTVTTPSGDPDLTFVAGQHVKIDVQYKDSTLSSSIQLQWLRPGQSTYIAIPQAQLYTLPGKGLVGTYYDNPTFNGSGVVTSFGPPATIRTDTQVDFAWASGSPDSTIAADTFAAHWEGEIKVPTNGTYTFRTKNDTDGGIKLWIDGNPVIDNWSAHSSAFKYSSPIPLTAGQKVTVVLEYYENTNTSEVHLAWGTAGAGGSFSTISRANLYTVGEEFSGLMAGWTVLNSTNYPGIDPTGSTAPAAITANTAAFNAALAALGTGSNSRVLYIPAGTYRINSLLAVSEKTGLSIIGENPGKVTIQWAGAANGTMFSIDHNTNLSLSRITWDGSGTADTAVIVHASNGGSTEFTEYVDNVFKNCRIGLQLGTNPATGFGDMDISLLTVRRCKFINDTWAGISVGEHNALNNNIWDSEFTDCKYGVTTLFGGGWNGATYLQGNGNFNVYHSIFRNSTVADIAPLDAAPYSIRDCFSTGSTRFVDTGGSGGYPLELPLQGNTILNTDNPTSVMLGLGGPLTLIDNVFVSAAGQTVAVVELSGVVDKDLISVGNIFTVSSPLNNWNNFQTNPGTGLPSIIRTRSVSDSVVSRTAIVPGKTYTYATIPEPEMPTTAPNMRRSIYEVAPGSNNATIQADLTNAAAGSSTGRTTTAGYLANVKPIVHVPQGGYSITTTLTIPARSDLQLIGDGQDPGDSALQWDGVNSVNGADGGTLLRVVGPSHATISNIYLHGNQKASNVVTIDNADQAGGHVAVSELNSIESAQGAFVERLDKTVVDLRNYFYFGDTDAGMKVVGGPLAQAGTPDPITGITPGVTAKVNVFGNFGGPLIDPLLGAVAHVVDLSKGGTLGLYDSWIEGNTAFFGAFTDKGTFTMQGGIIASTFDATHSLIDINGWNGKATLLDVETRGTINVSGTNANTQTLVMGNVLARQAPPTNYYTNNATSPNQGALYNQTAEYSHPVYIYSSVANSGLSTDAFLTTMLTQVRAEDHFVKWQPQSLGITDVHINRVWTRGSLGAGLRVTSYLDNGNATATANSNTDSARLAQNILTGRGMVGGLLGTDPNWNMYRAAVGVTTPTITIDLGAAYNLTGFRAWNFNATGFTNEGIQSVEVLTSTDGVNFTSRGTYTFNQASGLATEEGQAVSFGATLSGVKSVKLRVISNWGDPSYTGFGKIQFRTV